MSARIWLAVLKLCRYPRPCGYLSETCQGTPPLHLVFFFSDLSRRFCLALSFCFVSSCLFTFDFRYFFLLSPDKNNFSTFLYLYWRSKRGKRWRGEYRKSNFIYLARNFEPRAAVSKLAVRYREKRVQTKLSSFSSSRQVMGWLGFEVYQPLLVI